jgi:hypothetical protein
VLITSGRHPWEISGLCIFVIVGLALVGGAAPAPSSVDALLPGWFVAYWKVQLAIGAAAALAGISLPQSTVHQLMPSQLIERTAMIWFGTATLVFPIVLAATGRSPALTVIGYATAYGVGGLVRAWQISRNLTRLREASRPAEGEPS